MRLFNSLVIPIVMYRCETSTLKTEDKRKLLAFEMICFRRIDRIKHRITNMKLCQRLHSAESILSNIKKQQLRWFGHVQVLSPENHP